ncbi:MAG: NINE protein [Propionibacteriaceae bacterium]|jgi:hypothetical protein|nr:NINE protein [Propionibacteriaceae bacterium]
MSDWTNPQENAQSVPSYDGLDIGSGGYMPTPAASQYVGPMPGDPGFFTPAMAPAPAPTPEPPRGMVPDATYQVYDPTIAQMPNPVQPVVPTAYPVVAYPTASYPVPATMIPGQVVATPYGNFIVGNKSKVAAGLLGIFLGGLGVGQFYRGNVGLGVAQLLVTFFTAGVGGLWGFIEGIVVLASRPGSPSTLDSEGRLMS